VFPSTSYWSQLSAEDRAGLETLAERDVLPAGETAIRQRGRSNSVLIILRGHVVVISEAKPAAGKRAAGAARAPEARTKARASDFLAWRGPGDIVGELAAILKTPRSATVRAVEEIEILEIDGSDFMRYTRDHPDAHMTLTTVLALRNVESAGAARAERRRVPARVAQFLTEAADRVGRQSREGLWLPFPRTQGDLAELVRASRESVWAALKDLSDRDIVSTRPTRMTVRNLEALRKEWEDEL
jgi:CRP/FNR family transcriptional regulator, cyclic AMP receptor protein